MKYSIRAIAARCLPAALLTIVVIEFVAAAEKSADETMVIDLAAPKAGDQWLFTGSTGALRDGELLLDGRGQRTGAFFTPYEWEDVSLRASFLVEPQEQGVLACSLAVCAADGSNYYYVHFDRDNAVLVRANKSNEWNEIARIAVPDKPAGKWHTAELALSSGVLRVSLNGKQLLEAKDETLSRGRIGFFGGQAVVHVKDVAVTGKPLTPRSKFAIPEPDHVVVCSDAGNGGYEAFPDVCRLKDGRLMCVFVASYHHFGLPRPENPRGTRLVSCLSSDEGRTWSNPEVVFDSPDADQDPCIVQLDDGRLICSFFRLHRVADPHTPCPDPFKEAFTGGGSWMITSDDSGKNWSEPQLISKDHYASSPIRQLASGRLILGMYSEADGKAYGAVTFSDDVGKTWNRMVKLDNRDLYLDAETDVVELAPGRLLAAQRGSNFPLHWATSEDNGATWTKSQPAAFVAHAPYLHHTADGILVLGYRQVVDEGGQLVWKGTAMRVSRDGGKSWSDPVVVDSVVGAYPSMVNLKDGSVLAVYYEEGEGSNIRAKRFQVTSEGVEFLPFDKE